MYSIILIYTTTINHVSSEYIESPKAGYPEPKSIQASPCLL